MFPLEELVHHLDCNINKVKNGKDFLLLKDPEQVKREDELMNTAPYKQMKTVMLNKKFEGLLNERSKTEEKEQKRLKKMQEREEMQKAGGKFDGKKKMDDESSLTSKLLKGAFHQFESKAGIREDPCVSDLEVIKYARQAPLVILLIGKPRSGKTTTAMNLSASLDLIHIDCQRYIDRLLAKIATYEAPDDLEEGQEPPKWLSDFEEELHRQLKSGNGPNDQQIIEMLNLQIESDEAQTKGFILDLPFYKRKESWTELIKKGELKISHTSFSYIVELLYENPDISYRAENIRLNPDDGKSYSKWERDERKKPKVKKLTEEEEDEPVDEILKRVCDLPDFLSNELKHYHTIERPAFDDFIIRMYDN
jgi:DNA polymerase III delta prime subunit